MNIADIHSRIVFLKARELELMKETEATHEELMLCIGRTQGYEEGKRDGLAEAEVRATHPEA